MELVGERVPERTREQRLDAYAATLRRLNSLGLTGGHVMLGMPWLYDDVAELEARGDLTLRCAVPVHVEPMTSDDEVEELLAERDRGGRRWRGGVAKFFIDGVIDTGTAWLFEPGPHGEGTEPFWPDPGRYAEVVARFARAGFQCATHAIGDRAVAAALDAYRAAGRARGRAAPDRAHRDARRRRAAALRRRGRGGVDAAAARAGARRAGAVLVARQPPSRAGARAGSAGPTSAAAGRSSRSARTGRSSRPTRGRGWPGRGCGARRASPIASRSARTRR